MQFSELLKIKEGLEYIDKLTPIAVIDYDYDGKCFIGEMEEDKDGEYVLLSDVADLIDTFIDDNNTKSKESTQKMIELEQILGKDKLMKRLGICVRSYGYYKKDGVPKTKQGKIDKLYKKAIK